MVKPPFARGGVTVQLRIKKIFFDQPKVIAAVDEKKLKALHKAAGNIRRHARRSMRKVTAGQKRRREKMLAQVKAGRKANSSNYTGGSRPGKPPKIHTNDPENPRRILYGYDTANDVVIVGPLRFNTPTGVPELLEYGGQTLITVYPPFVQKKKKVSVTIKPRPFMRPALQKELPKIEGQWKDIMRAG